MTDNNRLTTLTSGEVATIVGVGTQTIRRWAEWHSAHLSQGANPDHGMPRRFVNKDLEVLRAINDLRYQGLQTDAINEQLAGLTFAEIDDHPPIDDQPAMLTESPVTSVTTPQQAPLAALAQHDLYTEIALLRSSIESIKDTQRASWWWLVAGIGIGLGLAVVAELFALLASRLH